MNFGQAIKALKQGERVCREGWNGKGMWLWHVNHWVGTIETQPDPFVYSEVLPFIAMKTADNKLVPWLASQADMLAEDWRIVEEVKEWKPNTQKQ